MTTPAAILALSDIKKFILAGHAIFTFASKKTGARKTFEVVQAEKKEGDPREPGYFVRLLIGPENSSDYRYLGFMYAMRDGRHAFKINGDRWGEEAYNCFVWLLQAIDDPTFYAAKFAEQAEFWHAGYCGRCGHLLTDPESIARGLGPVCASR